MQLGIDDPEQWLESQPERVLAVWEAYWKLEPWGLDWERHSRQMELMDHLLASTINPHLPKEDRYKAHGYDYFMPMDYVKPKKKRKSIAQQLNAFAAALGLKSGNND